MMIPSANSKPCQPSLEMPRALVLTGYGLNCDLETTHALTLAGARAERVHINALIDGGVCLSDYRMLVFGGGFSWADDHGAGVIQAIRMKTHIGEHLLRFIEQGNLIIGICNGFQTLVNLGLLPGFDKDYRSRLVALTYNDCGNFRDQWVHLAVNGASPCVFTRGLTHIELPVRHGEGKFFCEPTILEALEAGGQIVLRYASAENKPAGGHFPENPNGSLNDIAGICDSTGRVFGLMPHPEAFNHWSNHPDWSLLAERLRRGQLAEPLGLSPGVTLFQNAVSYLQNPSA